LLSILAFAQTGNDSRDPNPRGVRVNRYFRRLQRFGKSFSARRSQSEMTNQQGEVFDANTPQDVTSARAKSQAKGKVTADKWNQ
jgi:hypothetical protein